MTKLVEWLAGIALLFSVWYYLITNKEHNYLVRDNYQLIFYSPIIFVFLFGLYAAIVVLYRVYTFNNCEEAAAELQTEINEAKQELASLGFKFKETTK